MATEVSPFSQHPCREAFPVTPNDTNDLPAVSRGLYVGADGNIQVVLVGQNGPTLFTGVKGGQVYPLAVKRVYSTLTTATGIVALQ